MIHGCTKQHKSGKPKYLTKTDAQPNPDILTNNKDTVKSTKPK